MREIKFRAWHEENQEWMFFTLDEWKATLFDADEFTHRSEFTGLHDKSRKEIYEGDILTRMNRFGPVRWDETGSWACDWNDKAWNWRLPAFSGNELEVIGNIYENPELIK